jgi:hypothetical protein
MAVPIWEGAEETSEGSNVLKSIAGEALYRYDASAEE